MVHDMNVTWTRMGMSAVVPMRIDGIIMSQIKQNNPGNASTQIQYNCAQQDMNELITLSYSQTLSVSKPRALVRQDDAKPLPTGSGWA